ncbi:MAG TPA: tripartite tricarboxylate transporter substrate binding protein, partial [Burkholderiales bacterium]|nr:tripartite tricarboxylate transporter substrate binding protein [Burkholderiales bacterium]
MLKAAIAGAIALAVLQANAAENFPSKPIRMIVPTGAGGVTDVLGRVVAHKLGESLGQQVVIDNRPGASGIVGSQLVAGAAPDGYTLLMVFPTHVVNPFLFKSMPYDTEKAFSPITIVSTVSLLLTVNPDLPAKSTQELIAYAKANPGKLNYGTVGSGSLGHLGAELFRSMSDTRMTQIAYKGSPQILAALIGGEINMYMVASISGVMPQLKSGRVRALGVSTKQSLPVLPDVPPIANALPGYEARGWNGILAPAGTPKPIIDKLHSELVKVVQSPEFGQILAREGATPVGNTPAEFDAIIRA